MYKIKKTTKTIARYPCEGNKITGRYFNGILWCTNARIRLLRRTLEKIFFASLRTPEDSESINGITSSMMSIVSSHNSKITVQPCSTILSSSCCRSFLAAAKTSGTESGCFVHIFNRISRASPCTGEDADSINGNTSPGPRGRRTVVERVADGA